MVVDEGPNIFHVQCICGRIRVSLEKKLCIHRLYFIKPLRQIYMEKVRQELLWALTWYKQYQNTSSEQN